MLPRRKVLITAPTIKRKHARYDSQTSLAQYDFTVRDRLNCHFTWRAVMIMLITPNEKCSVIVPNRPSANSHQAGEVSR